jgi:hypothetical protein
MLTDQFAISKIDGKVLPAPRSPCIPSIRLPIPLEIVFSCQVSSPWTGGRRSAWRERSLAGVFPLSLSRLLTHPSASTSIGMHTICYLLLLFGMSQLPMSHDGCGEAVVSSVWKQFVSSVAVRVQICIVLKTHTTIGPTVPNFRAASILGPQTLNSILAYSLNNTDKHPEA